MISLHRPRSVHSPELKCSRGHMKTAVLACLGVSAIEICSMMGARFFSQA